MVIRKQKQKKLVEELPAYFIGATNQKQKPDELMYF